MKEKLNTEGCKKMVWDGGFHDHPCSRRAKLDGYCKQHHPDAEKERDKKSHAKWLKEINIRRWERDCINVLAGVENPGKAVRDLVEAVNEFMLTWRVELREANTYKGLEKALKPFQGKP